MCPVAPRRVWRRWHRTSLYLKCLPRTSLQISTPLLSRCEVTPFDRFGNGRSDQTHVHIRRTRQQGRFIRLPLPIRFQMKHNRLFRKSPFHSASCSRKPAVSVIHVNRKGDEYHLLQSVTKTGKPKYYVSKKPGLNTVEQIPDGFELYEQPTDGMVHFRRIRPTSILPEERTTAIAMILKTTKRDLFFAECEGDSLVIYWPDRDPYAASEILSRMFGIPADLGMLGPSIARKQVDWGVLQMLRTSPVLRFTLRNEAKRTFTAERMCYRGGDEFWLSISKAAKLEELVRTFASHLGKESIFDLL